MPLIATAEDLGSIVREARKARGWSQAWLARETGVSRQWLIDVERGKPGAELGRVLRLLAVLGVTLHGDQLAASSTSDIDDIVERARQPR